ncbi:MAG: deoxyribodipyrimidine photo-lyase [Chlorobium sp.]|nr:MAG: deoxyribodipyrimidine photo-lyase [Chlorobium sp.]
MPEPDTLPVDPRRITLLNECAYIGGPVLYWMSRDQRVRNNWALLFAHHKAATRKQPLTVVFTLAPSFPGAAPAHYRFMLEGLQEIETGLGKLNIPFTLLFGEPEKVLPDYLDKTGAGIVVSDYSPLKISRGWKSAVAKNITVPLYEVDTHNIVPCRIASEKQEFSARTLRPKITAMLGEFLRPFPDLKPLPYPFADHSNDWRKAFEFADSMHDSTPAGWPVPGENAAKLCLESFISGGLHRYSEKRNDPNACAVSNLSPYLHFGQISAQSVALRVITAGASEADTAAFLEELIVRRELSENYCHYNARYDTYDGIPAWARATLDLHSRDPRDYIYGEEAFEKAATHDRLWNAAQRELLETGKIHGYMRMYWAKKILEWSETPRMAFETALKLNDRFALDGRDPNGYTGVAWSIGGVHDRPWFERPVYGKIRYMNASGCARKFDVEKYINRFGC